MNCNRHDGGDGESWQVQKSTRKKTSNKNQNTSSATVNVRTEHLLVKNAIQGGCRIESQAQSIKSAYDPELRSSFKKPYVKLSSPSSISTCNELPVSESLEFLEKKPDWSLAAASTACQGCGSCSSDATGSRSIILVPEFHINSSCFLSKKNCPVMGHNDTSEQHKETLSLIKAGKQPKKKRQSCSSKLPPQDTRVCLISSSDLEKWSQCSTEKSYLLKKSSLPQEKDFPDLSTVLKGLSKCNATSQNLSEISENEGNIGEGHKKSWPKALSRKNKQPSRKDPIFVRIFDIIKRPSASCPARSRTHLKSEERWRLGGNILDSSNPIRKRGKHREIPCKKKFSKLKLVIINERKKKREKTELDLKVLNNTSSVIEEASIDSICAQILPLKIESSSPIDSTDDDLSKLHKVECLEEDLVYDAAKNSQSNQLGIDYVPKLSSSGSSQVSLNTSAVSPSAMHSRKFREYCDNIRSKELDDAVTNLLKEIYRFQDRFHQKDPVLALAKRRFVLGIREVKKYLMLRKLKAIVVAPDLEPVRSPGGLDETVKHVREEGKFQQIPVVFAVGRRQLGFALKKKVPISMVGIINPEGAEELYQCMLEKWRIAVVQYQQTAQELCNSSHVSSE